jgi:hypothetical protein
MRTTPTTDIIGINGLDSNYAFFDILGEFFVAVKCLPKTAIANIEKALALSFSS